MKIPFSWIKEYLPTTRSADEIALTLTMAGLEVDKIEHREGDSVFEISLTPNLSHCASVRGVARELTAFIGEELCASSPGIVSEDSGQKINQEVEVLIENPEACPRYTCRLIQGVTVAPSPDWLVKKLTLCGLASVNNVVDCTNLVLWELGQPLHAFDFDTLEGRKVIVRNAENGERIVTLDSKEHYPTRETLLICNEKKPLAIAGIMGSLDSGVGQNTKNVLLEAAYFTPSQIRKSARRMGLHTEASHRFERGTDPNALVEALDRAAFWIVKVAGGKVVQGIIDKKQREFPPIILSCRLSRTNKILGTQLVMNEIELIFKRLGFILRSIKDDTISVSIPTYRHDIHQEIDLIEEVARVYGLQNISKPERATYRSGKLPDCAPYLFEKKMRGILLKLGLQELLTCDLISPAKADLILLDSFPSRSLIHLLNPYTSELSVLRPSLLPGLLSVVKLNADHGNHSLSGFELGRVHFKTKDHYLEPAVVAFVLCGEVASPHWERDAQQVDFFELKGILEDLFDSLKVKNVEFLPASFANFHPGRQATVRIEGIEAGIMGEVHPLILKKMGIDYPVLFSELNLEDIQRFVPSQSKMTPLPLFPSSSRDWTITVPEALPFGKILDLIQKERSALLESVSLLDVYHSDKLGIGSKNITFRFIYRDSEKTVSMQAVEEEHTRLSNSISNILTRE